MPGYRYRGTIRDAHEPHHHEKPTRRHKAPIAKCGTTGGYSRHRNLGEPVCDDCREANAAYCRERREALKANA